MYPFPVSGVSNGDQGGIARLATLKKQLLAKNPNTVMILSGDLLSPSALSTALYQGRSLAGRQMVAAFNAAGLDYATFGNHVSDCYRRNATPIPRSHHSLALAFCIGVCRSLI